MSGKHLWYLGLALFASLAFIAPAGAADGGGGPGGGGGKGPGGKRPPNPIDFILKHASDLNLTDDQKTQLQALQQDCKNNPPPPPPQDQGGGNTDKKSAQKPPPGPPPGMEKIQAILTPDQMDKLKELHDKAGDHPKPPKPPQN